MDKNNSFFNENIGSTSSIISSKSKLIDSRILPAVILFVLWFLTAKFGQYIFISHQTSPALIWPPSGIALAFVLIYGYRMWIPIALAAFFASFTSPLSPVFLVVLAATLGQTLQPVVGAYLLKGAGFRSSFKDSTDVLKFLGISIIIATIAPTIIAYAQLFTHTLSTTLFISWSRSFSGRLLSIIVLTPLIVTWFPWHDISRNRNQVIETLSAFGILLGIVYVFFWTTLAQSISFILLVALFGNLFWIALRLGSRAMSLAIFLMTSLSMAGVIIASPSTKPLNEQLFSIELFIILVAPIFVVFSALLNERRSVVSKLEDNMSELKDAMQRLSNEDRSKNEFIAILAHELRNPLAPIMSTFELLKLENQSPESIKMIEAAEAQTKAMKRLLEDLLDVARVVQKKFKLNKQTVDLHQAIANCVYSTESLMRKRGHTFVVGSLPSEKVFLNADQVRFEQIIVNLLNNAAKYTNPGGHIELSCIVSGNKLEIRVKDDGLGISKEDIEHVFEPFRNLKSKPSMNSGLGVGLSISKRLVEMHDGEIRAISKGLNKGSTFIVTFPIPDHVQLPLPVTQSNIEKNLEVKSKQSFKVLVVDDNKSAAQGLGKLLEIKGHEVTLAYSGESALKAVEEFNPQVVLLDIGLPDMDGYQVVRKLRNENFPGSVVALTGYGQEEDKLKAQTAGFSNFLVKPVGIAELENVLYQSV